MEALTTIWQFSTISHKWIRVKDIVDSLANERLLKLKVANPNKIYVVSEKKPTKLKL
ncbi:MAG: hypothetical protein M0R17_03570 [Candidatus Omnitrophica bacterium]|jgi:hypothetical protein|nr:hypothetical protein [Candidatus Omnitrophota bacterium]